VVCCTDCVGRLFDNKDETTTTGDCLEHGGMQVVEVVKSSARHTGTRWYAACGAQAQVEASGK